MEAFEKNEKQATKLRTQGNQKFKKGDLFEALMLFNQSLCFADNVISVSLCYANRAAVYLHLKLYERCLNNIKLARKDYPEEKIKKLDECEEKCLNEYLAATDAKPAEDSLKLSYTANSKLRFAVECLELKENEKFGRHIVTNRNLKAGDIVAITPNIYNVLHRPARFHSCSFCLKSNDIDLMPCPDCSRAMYCSRRCMLEDKKEIHQEYCKSSITYESEVEFAKRMMYRSIYVFKESIDQISRHRTPHHNVFDFDFSNCRNPTSCKNMLLAALGEKKNLKDEKTSLIDSFCSLTDYFAVFSICFSKKISKDETKDDTKNLNMFLNIGWSFHPFALLFNTSCKPNVQVLNSGNQGVSVWIVNEPIEADGQLFISYSTYSYSHNWPMISKSKRRKYWKENCGFKCVCEACVNDWKIEDLKDFYKLRICFDTSLKYLSSREEAEKKFKENCKYINKHFKEDFPSAKLVQKSFENQFCLQIMYQ